MLVLRTAKPIAALRLGEEISGRIAGSGNDGAGDADRLNDGDEPKDERRLWVIAGGGSMGSGVVSGVPGLDGAGEAIGALLALALDALC
jgi:hypothetical protein